MYSALVSSEKYMLCVSVVLVALGSICTLDKAGRIVTSVSSVPYHIVHASDRGTPVGRSGHICAAWCTLHMKNDRNGLT